MSSKGRDKTKTSQKSGKKGFDSEPKTPQKSGKKGFDSEQIMGRNLFLPDIDEKNLKKVFGNTKALTVYGTAKVLNVNAAVALRFLKELETKKLVVRIGGFSGHYIWKVESL